MTVLSVSDEVRVGAEAGIGHRVHAWARRTPDAVAVQDGDTRTTYAELDRAADRLAACLRDRGVAAEEPVLIALPRSAEFVVAALAVLRAGGCYVPVDPEYPQARQAVIIERAGARRAIAAGAPAQRLRAAGVDVLTPTPDTVASGHSAATTGPPGGSGALAYVIYTSGSTGVPKGVAVTHADVLNLVDADPRLAVAPGEVVAHLAPTAFDASTFELWTALCRGGRVAVIGRDGVSIESLGAELRAAAPAWLFLTTGLFHLLVDHDLDALAGIAHVLTGGDVLAPRQVRAAAAAVTGQLHAAYGPTETTVFASLHDADPAREYDRVPLGSPLRDKRMYVLDDRMTPVPDGTVGQLYLGGAGVARGYHADPAATADRFVPDPYAPGARLYRTGDLGRVLPDGEFEFCGRADRQVKIRGFRIELGEVESALAAHPGVTGAAAVAAADAAGAKRLAAYVSVAADSHLSAGDLRAWMAERLPAFSRPSYYVLLDALPLDPNGKIDRSALPEPWSSRDRLNLPPYEPPRTAGEETVAVLFAETFGLDRVGREDDFFQLGGDSLRSVAVLELLRAGGVTVTAREFFKRPRVSDLAELVDRVSARGPARSGR